MAQVMTPSKRYELGLEKLQRILDMPPIKTEACVYYCNGCGSVFASAAGPTCPTCGATGKPNVVLIRVDNDPLMDYMYSKADWNAGD